MKNKIIKYTITAAFWVAVWQLISLVVGLEILVPSPIKTLTTLFSLLGEGKFYLAVVSSLIRIISGFAFGVIVGLSGAILSVRLSLFKTLFSPILRLVRAVPVASFIILAFVWIKTDLVPVFISFLMVLPIVWDNAQSGILNTDKKLLEMGRVFGLTEKEILTRIKIPSIVPSLISACMTALGLSWKAGIAAEVICKPISSLGGNLADAKVYLETPTVFAVTGVVVILSLLLEILIKRTVRRFTYDKYE